MSGTATDDKKKQATLPGVNRGGNGHKGKKAATEIVKKKYRAQLRLKTKMTVSISQDVDVQLYTVGGQIEIRMSHPKKKGKIIAGTGVTLTDAEKSFRASVKEQLK